MCTRVGGWGRGQTGISESRRATCSWERRLGWGWGNTKSRLCKRQVPPEGQEARPGLLLLQLLCGPSLCQPCLCLLEWAAGTGGQAHRRLPPGQDTAGGRGRGRPPAQTLSVLPARPASGWTGSVDPTELGRDHSYSLGLQRPGPGLFGLPRGGPEVLSSPAGCAVLRRGSTWIGVSGPQVGSCCCPGELTGASSAGAGRRGGGGPRTTGSTRLPGWLAGGGQGTEVDWLSQVLRGPARQPLSAGALDSWPGATGQPGSGPASCGQGQGLHTQTPQIPGGHRPPGQGGCVAQHSAGLSVGCQGKGSGRERQVSGCHKGRREAKGLCSLPGRGRDRRGRPLLVLAPQGLLALGMKNEACGWETPTSFQDCHRGTEPSACGQQGPRAGRRIPQKHSLLGGTGVQGSWTLVSLGGLQ